MKPPATKRCGNCRRFSNSGAAVEAAFPGLASLSSGYAAVRGDDGVCALHGRYVQADSLCAAYLTSSGVRNSRPL